MDHMTVHAQDNFIVYHIAGNINFEGELYLNFMEKTYGWLANHKTHESLLRNFSVIRISSSNENLGWKRDK